jgi:ATP-binding cassette, subfamily B, bacterial
VTTATDYSDLALIRRLFSQARRYWVHIGGFFLVSLLATPLALLAPLPLKIAVDSAIGSRPLPDFLDTLLPGDTTPSTITALIIAAGLVVVVGLFSEMQELAEDLLREYAGGKLTLGLRTQLFRQAQRLSLLYHDSRGVTDSTYRIQYDAPAIRYVMIDGVIPLITSVFTLAGMLYVTAKISLQLALITLVIAPILILLSWAYSRRLRTRWLKVHELDGMAFSVTQEALAAIRVVKAFGQEDREARRYARHSQESLRENVRVAFVEGVFGVLIGLATAAGTATVLFMGVRLVLSGALTLGDLLLVVGYLTQIYGPLNTLSSSKATLQSSLASVERAFSLLDEAPDVAERPDAQALARASGAVIFRGVSFAYRENDPVLHNVSFGIDPGTRVGISGRTGAGKSTLMSLLTRFYDPTEGEILLDGRDLRDYKLADLRDQFAIVLQEPVLFSTSIAENISYARPHAKREEVVEAAKAANAHEFIVELSDGYETEVGERGMSLSGGERQRIALARAFLKDAPILILDEPTSSVDTKTEAAIMDAMERLMRGRTTLMIAHRLGTLANCDTRLEIEDGRIVRFEQRRISANGGGSTNVTQWLDRSREIS